MTVEVPLLPNTTAPLRTKRKRKNQDYQDPKGGSNLKLYDAKEIPCKLEKKESVMPCKSKRYMGSSDCFEKETINDGKEINDVNGDGFSKAMEIFKKKYGSEVAKDIFKTLSASLPIGHAKNKEEVAADTDSYALPGENPVSSGVNAADMLKYMCMFFQNLPQMSSMFSNVAMNPTSTVTNANSEFVMRSSFNNDDEEERDAVNSINSVVTTTDSLKSPASIATTTLVPSSINQNNLSVSSAEKFSSNVTTESISSVEQGFLGNNNVSSRSVSIVNPFQNANKSSKLKFPDHPLVIRGPTIGENSVVDQKPLLISKPFINDNESLDGADKKMIAACSYVGDHNNIPFCDQKDEADKKLITACSDTDSIVICNDAISLKNKDESCNDIVTTVTAPVSDQSIMKLLQTNGATGGSFIAFCDEMNDPEQQNINLLDDTLLDEEGRSPVYEPIATTKKHTLNISDSEEEDGIHSSVETGLSIPSSALMTHATENLVIHDNNKSYMNLDCNTKYSDELNGMRNSVASSLNLGCSTTLASQLKPWEYEVAEFESKLRNELPPSDVLLPMNHIYGTTFSGGERGAVNSSSWYHNCMQNFSLQDDDGDTILHIGIAKEDSRVVDLISLMNADDFNITNNLGQTPLHVACYVHQNDIISALIQGGADEGIVDENGNTPLHIACDEKSLPMVQCLVECFKDKPERLKNMMSHHNNNGLTPLHIAAQKREHQIVEYLVDNGCDLDVQDERSGSTVLIYSLINNDERLTRYFIDKGADLNIPTSSALYPLNFAAQTGNIGLVKDMVLRDADIGNKLPEFPADNPASAEMKNIFEKELRKRRRKKKRDELKHQAM